MRRKKKYKPKLFSTFFFSYIYSFVQFPTYTCKHNRDEMINQSLSANDSKNNSNNAYKKTKDCYNKRTTSRRLIFPRLLHQILGLHLASSGPQLWNGFILVKLWPNRVIEILVHYIMFNSLLIKVNSTRSILSKQFSHHRRTKHTLSSGCPKSCSYYPSPHLK